MYNFCTLFDYDFLPSGLALYQSLKKYSNDFHLFIFAFDDKCYDILKKLDLSDVTVISLKEFEDKKLLLVKPSRLRSEYCYTCTPSTILYVLKNFKVDSCTYIDSDIYFYGKPDILFNEMGNNSVIISPHRYTVDMSEKFGKYCVQFVTFKNDKKGLRVLRWWRNKCIEWCYSRVENGKFADQKYLDDWQRRFQGVHEMEHLGGGVAPWNVQQYDVLIKNKRIVGNEKKFGRQFPFIFFHFHAFRHFQNDVIQLTNWYELSKEVINLVYKPYFRHLEKIKAELRRFDGTIVFTYSRSPEEPKTFKGWVDWIIRNVKTEIEHWIRIFSYRNISRRIRVSQYYEKKQLLEE